MSPDWSIGRSDINKAFQKSLEGSWKPQPERELMDVFLLTNPVVGTVGSTDISAIGIQPGCDWYSATHNSLYIWDTGELFINAVRGSFTVREIGNRRFEVKNPTYGEHIFWLAVHGSDEGTRNKLEKAVSEAAHKITEDFKGMSLDNRGWR